VASPTDVGLMAMTDDARHPVMLYDGG